MLTDNHGERMSYARIVWSPRSDAGLVPMRPLPSSGAMSLVRFPIHGRPERTLAQEGGAIAEMAWSPDAARVYYVGAEDRLQGIDVATGARRPLVPERQLGARAFAEWRDGDRDVVAYIAGWLTPEKQLYAAPLEGSGPLALTTDGGYVGLRLDASTGELVGERQDAAGTVEEVRVAPRTHAIRRGARHAATPVSTGSVPVLSLTEKRAPGRGRARSRPSASAACRTRRSCSTPTHSSRRAVARPRERRQLRGLFPRR